MRNQRIYRERGVSLVIVALGLAMIMGLAGLSIDLASFYVTRNEEQRSADAAALAGADTFVNSGITIDPSTETTAMTEAETQAVQVGNANLVVGRSPGLDPSNFYLGCSSLPTNVSGGCFDFSNATNPSETNDPRITVQVYEKMPTYFMKIFGIDSVPVSASATAEAYNPIGGGPLSSAKCVKPWMMPNCDYGHMVPNPTSGNPEPSQANGYCPQLNSEYPAYYIYPQSQPATTIPNQAAILSTDYGTVVNPAISPTGSIGELIQLKTGNPQLAPAPSQFYPVFLPDPNPTFECPSCASSDQQQSTSSSAARYKEFIECCSNSVITCGNNSINPVTGVSTVTGNKVGPTGQGVDCLIHQGPGGTGQDTISWESESPLTLPYIMYAGSGNGLNPTGAVITISDSVVTVPVYDGETLCPGGSCPSSTNVDVQGWLQLFITGEGAPAHTVDAYILSITSCGGSTSSTGNPPVISTTGSAIPVRLIH